MSLRQISCLSNLVLQILKFQRLGPGIKGTFLITVRKSSSSYTYNKKELYEGNITYTCNVNNWLYCKQLQTNYEKFFELKNDNVDQEQDTYV